MDETINSLSDVRITSLITTSITDMVRQEVGKIMQELNMPVCIEAIDRIIAENLDKEVEKQNFIKTYKRKLNKVNQYKCIEKHADADELVITNLQVIESRVKKLEDFVLQNLMQRPQLMQDLAVRSRENLVFTCENQQKIGENKCNGYEMIEKSEQNAKNEIRTVKPMLLNLDDVIKVIKECPETQDSFDIFQSAAERIKEDLERFIQDYKSDLREKAKARGREELGEVKKIANSSEKEDLKIVEISKNMNDTEIDLKNEVYVMEAVESVALVSTSIEVVKAPVNFEHETNSSFAVEELPTIINMQQTEQEIVRPTVEEITKVAMEATTDLQAEHKTQSEKVETVAKTVFGGDTNSLTQHMLMTSMACGDKLIIDLGDQKLPKTMTTEQELKNAKICQSPNVEKEYKHCKECTERMQFMRERTKPYAIDEDIKWKLDKILDHIGDFCSRSRGGGKESISEPNRKTIPMNANQQQPQPGTSADFTKRRMTRSGSVKPKQGQHIAKKSTALNGKQDRNNLDRIMDQIRYMGNHMKQRQEVVITDAMSKIVPNIITPVTLTTITTTEPPTKSKVSKSLEQPRSSVEAFKTKWGLEYSKNSIAKAPANTEHAKHAPKSTLPPRNNTEAIPKAAMKRRQQERGLPPIPLQMPLPVRPQQVVQKSSTTLMLESIDKLARSAATKTSRISRVGHTHDDIGWVYSRRSTSQAPSVNLSEVRRTKVLYHNYKL